MTHARKWGQKLEILCVCIIFQRINVGNEPKRPRSETPGRTEDPPTSHADYWSHTKTSEEFESLNAKLEIGHTQLSYGRWLLGLATLWMWSNVCE